MSTPDVPAWMLDHLGEKLTPREAGVARVLSSMTERERALVKEAAVMGFVNGVHFQRDRKKGQRVPDDTDVLLSVIDACLSFADIYPTISGCTKSDTEKSDGE